MLATAPGVLLKSQISVSHLDHAPDHPDTFSSSESTESDQMFGLSKFYKSPGGAVNEDSRYDVSVRRRSTIRKKVDKLTTSTKSLFNRSKSKKEDKILQEGEVKHDDLKYAYKTLELSEPVYVPGAASLEGPCSRPIPSRLPNVEVLDSGPIMAAFTPLPDDSDEDLSLISATSAIDVPTRDASGACGEDITPIPDAENPKLDPKPDISKSEPTGNHEAHRLPRKDYSKSPEVPKLIPASPSPSEASSYLSGSIPYAKIAIFALTVGFCAVAVPHTYRLLRTR